MNYMQDLESFLFHKAWKSKECVELLYDNDPNNDDTNLIYIFYFTTDCKT